MKTNIIDIREDDILHRSPELLSTLLKDQTMSREKKKDWNIFWATSDYEQLGDGFQYADMGFVIPFDEIKLVVQCEAQIQYITHPFWGKFNCIITLDN